MPETDAAIAGIAEHHASRAVFDNSGKFATPLGISFAVSFLPAPGKWVEQELTGDSHGSPSCQLSAVVFTLCLAGTAQCRYPASFPFPALVS